MPNPLVSDIDISPAAVLSRLIDWTAEYRRDPCPGAVVDVLVGFAFFVGLQAGTGRQGLALHLLGRLAEEQPSAFRRSADVAHGLFEPEPATTC